MDSFDTLLTAFVDGSLDGETAIEHLILAAASNSTISSHGGVSPTHGASSVTQHLSAHGSPNDGSPLPVNADTIEDYGSYCTIA
ncbi:pheromone [Schizophyllum commune H4-8]|uniref:Pheromone n=1 Tax=Schizophyllum commune (strain H4-8 / FGSC 9210) TaxID=578458 RepID=D8QF33_SCHCM|nr:pheromone [Schizophyllum commune H4-8]KAI5887463.1 pheromone [Schizophyllum commune H4-8]